MNAPQIAICIGHSRLGYDGKRDGGAVSCAPELQEWDYNRHLACLIAERLHDAHGITVTIVGTYEGTGYRGAMRWLAARLESLGVKLAVELHFNSAESPQARGHEWLHWHASPAGRGLAAELHNHFSLAMTGIPARGVKAVGHGQRGAEFLRLTHCPAVICEPFFGSSSEDWDYARTNPGVLADAMAAGLAQALARL